MPLLIGIRDDPRGWRGNVSAAAGSKMPAGRGSRGGGRRGYHRNVSDVKNGARTGRRDGCSREGGGGDEGINGGRCVARVTLKRVRWGEESRVYHRAEIFQQTSLSFHLPNADGGGNDSPLLWPDGQDCNAAGNYRALFSTLSPPPPPNSPYDIDRTLLRAIYANANAAFDPESR